MLWLRLGGWYGDFSWRAVHCLACLICCAAQRPAWPSCHRLPMSLKLVINFCFDITHAGIWTLMVYFMVSHSVQWWGGGM